MRSSRVAVAAAMAMIVVAIIILMRERSNIESIQNAQVSTQPQAEARKTDDASQDSRAPASNVQPEQAAAANPEVTDRRHRMLLELIQQNYSEILVAFGLTSEAKAAVERLIIERYKIESDAVEVAQKRLADDKKFETTADLQKAVAAVRQDIDKEIERAAGSAAPKVKELLASKLELTQVQRYARGSASQGAPMSAMQKFALASALSSELNPERNPSSEINRITGIEDGLAVGYRNVLRKLDGQLSPQQIQYLRSEFQNETAIISAGPKPTN